LIWRSLSESFLAPLLLFWLPEARSIVKFARNKLTRTAAVAMTLLAMNAHDAWPALSTKVETLAAIAGYR